MKRKEILARAITLGLLLAMPLSGAWAEELTGNLTLSDAASYTGGLKVNNRITLDGKDNNVNVEGTISDGEDSYGVINNGTIQNIGTLTAESVLNSGKLTVDNLQITEEAFVNSGNNAEAVIYGGYVQGHQPPPVNGLPSYPVGGIVNEDGATLNIYGDLQDDGFFINSNATINVGDNVELKLGGIGEFYNEGTINAANAVVKLEKYNALGLSGSHVNIGTMYVKRLETKEVFANAGEMIVQDTILCDQVRGSGFINEGIIKFVGDSTEPIKYNPYVQNDQKLPLALNNFGSIYVASGEMNLKGINIYLEGENPELRTDENNDLKSLSTNQLLSLRGEDEEGVPVNINLSVKENISAKKIENQFGIIRTEVLAVEDLVNYGIDMNLVMEEDLQIKEGTIIADTIELGNSMVNGYNDGFENIDSIIQVNNAIIYTGNNTGSFENNSDIYFTGQEAGIIGNILVENKYLDENNYGRIIADESGSKITNLTIEGTLNNEGVIAAETLSVANGFDGKNNNGNVTSSAGFNVDNLNILDGGSFALNSAVYEFENIGVGTDANLSAVNNTIAMADGGSISSGGSVSLDKVNAVDGKLILNPLAEKENQIVIKELAGSGVDIYVNNLTANQVKIEKFTGDSANIFASKDITDQIDPDNPTNILQQAADTGTVIRDNNDQTKLVHLSAGSLLDKIEAWTDSNGKIISYSDIDLAPENKGLGEMASIALMTWRQENNDMNKRLGELRDSKGEHGIWARMTRGEAKYGAQNIKNQYNSYQLGYDEKLSVDKTWTVGAAFTYTDANSSFTNGHGENKHKGFAVYGSRLNDDGSFIDLIAKYARLEHEFDVNGGAGRGDYNTNGYSVSAEYGKRFTNDKGLWIEPQVELTYGKVGSVNYVTNQDVSVRQDGMESVVGRVGFALGKNFKQGNAYLRASYLYDFEGETDVRFAKGGSARSFEQDLGGGWWEVGVGANVNVSEATHLYFDVEKTYGGNVATPWQWNAGVRWSF